MTSIAGVRFNGESAVAIGVSMVSESGAGCINCKEPATAEAITLQPLVLASSGNEVTILLDHQRQWHQLPLPFHSLVALTPQLALPILARSYQHLTFH